MISFKILESVKSSCTLFKFSNLSFDKEKLSRKALVNTSSKYFYLRQKRLSIKSQPTACQQIREGEQWQGSFCPKWTSLNRSGGWSQAGGSPSLNRSVSHGDTPLWIDRQTDRQTERLKHYLPANYVCGL